MCDMYAYIYPHTILLNTISTQRLNLNCSIISIYIYTHTQIVQYASVCLNYCELAYYCVGCKLANGHITWLFDLVRSYAHQPKVNIRLAEATRPTVANSPIVRVIT